jgi:RNA polymerase sigma factor (sigma-70 family)
MSPPDIQHITDLYYQDLYRFALSLSRHEADALDLTQQTILIFARKGSTLEDPSKAKSWLFTTLHREHIRQAKRMNRFQFLPDAEATALSDTLSGAAREADHATSTQVDGAAAVDALQQLEDTLKAPLTLFYLEGMKYREIAEILEIPIGTVMSRLARAKAALREKLGVTSFPIPAL